MGTFWTWNSDLSPPRPTRFGDYHRLWEPADVIVNQDLHRTGRGYHTPCRNVVPSSPGFETQPLSLSVKEQCTGIMAINNFSGFYFYFSSSRLESLIVEMVVRSLTRRHHVSTGVFVTSWVHIELIYCHFFLYQKRNITMLDPTRDVCVYY